MKHLYLLTISIFICISNYGQGLTDYSDIINFDDNYKTTKSNLAELKTEDLSRFWTDNNSEIQFGFIDNNYQRLDIKFISIIKNPNDPLEYFVYGKSMVSKNICEFQGVIIIRESFYIKSAEYDNGNSGILAGKYTFYENPNSSHSGVFKGRFSTYWYKDKNGDIKYSDLWASSAEYNNNQFAGIWSQYGKDKEASANWGDSRIPLSGDLDVGTSEFCPAEKYRSNGWESFMEENGANQNKIIEEEDWWREK